MKNKEVLSGAQACAEAIKLVEPGVIPVYPITPQTIISETIAQMIADGEMSSEMINVESEHSAMSACIGAQATGVRTYTATSSQGLALMHEMLFVASGLRLPIIMGVVNRSLSAPLSIWNDQQDSFSQRDAGWIQLYVENAQEALDTHIQAYKIGEKVNLPVMICLDGYVISHTYEPVEIPEKDEVKRFLGEYSPPFALNPAKPITIGPVATPEYYMEFKKQQHDAMFTAKKIITEVNRNFASMCGRKYGNGLIETIDMEGKEHALITIGSVTGTAREAIKNTKTGIIRIKSLRPFPAEQLREICEPLKCIGILEKDISLGANGTLYDETRSALYSLEERPKVSGFIGGLGGKDIKPNEVSFIIKKIESGKEGCEWL